MDARNSDTVTLSRKEFAEVMNLWSTFVARLMAPSVKRDPGAMVNHTTREARIFRTAVVRQTRNAFLVEHADDFAKALEEAIVGESLQRSLSGDKPVQRQQPVRGGVQILKPGDGKVADGLGKKQATLSLRRPKNKDGS